MGVDSLLLLLSLAADVADGEGDASVLAFFFAGVAEELALLEVVFFFAGELEVDAALVPDFFVVEVVPVVDVFLVVLAALVLVCVSLCAQETIKAPATATTMQGSRNFFIGVFDQTVQPRLKSQAYSGASNEAPVAVLSHERL